MVRKFPILRASAVVVSALVGLAGCGAQLSQGGTADFTTATGPKSGGAADPAYVLSADERDLDCKQITGKLQIRILELRASGAIQATSGLSRGMQSAARSTFGASAAGLDPRGEHARDLAMIDAYNRELVARDCRSYDLAKALSDTETVPTPTVPPPSKAER